MQSSTKSLRKVLTLVGVGLTSLTGQAALAQTAPTPGCVVAGLPAPQVRRVGGQTVYVRPLATILNEAIDDFGANGIDDALSVYCVTTAPSAPRGTSAMCLTHERCPWR